MISGRFEVAKKKNAAEPVLDKVKVTLDKIRLRTVHKLFPDNKKDHLREYLRRAKPAGS
jgi:hypothetical protein